MTPAYYQSHPKSWWILRILAAIALIMLIGVFLGWLLTSCTVGLTSANKPELNPPAASPGVTATVTPSPDPSPSPSPTVTATASPSATASSSASPRFCPPPAEPNGQIAINQQSPASDTTWMIQFQGTAVSRIVYDGVPASAESLSAWVNAAACNGFAAEIRPNKVVGSNTALQNANAAASLCWGEWYPNVTPTCHGDYLPVYLPHAEPNDYGPVSNYAKVGHDATSGWAAVQAFSWTESISVPHADPDEVNQVRNVFHFPTHAPPTPEEVGGFARQLHDAGVKNILIYTEFPSASNIDYLKKCIAEVGKVLGR